MEKRIERIEKELEVMRKTFKQTQAFIKSDAEKTTALTLFTKTILQFMKDTNASIRDLQNSYVVMSKNNKLKNR